MAQVGIIRVGDAYYRDYAIEPGDTLIGICLRFGHTDWRAIYDDPVNTLFKDRFTDPDQIDFVNSVNLKVPLAGATTSGKSRKGKPVGDYLVVRIRWPSGTPVAVENFRLLGPGEVSTGRVVTTTIDGEVILTNPAPGDWQLVSPTLALVAPDETGTEIPPREVPLAPPAPVLVDPVSLPRNEVTDFVAEPVYALRCPMCWTIFAVTVQPAPGTGGYTCPNDGFDWTTIVTAVDTNPTTFLKTPMPPQNPSTTPTGLVCRGVEASPLTSVYGPATVYWDESRFVQPDGGDYTLRGTDKTGTVHSSLIVGRHIWGADPPRPGPGKVYEFQMTLAGASPPYLFPIPSNETHPLTAVLKWITIHHSTDAPFNSFETPRSIQQKHFIKIGKGGPGADIGYQYIVDGDGTVYEGRPLGIKGSHVPVFNGGNVGIVLMGDFERSPARGGSDPTAPQLAAMTELVDTINARFGVLSAWYHQERTKQSHGPMNDEETECPGARLIPLLGPMRTKYPGPPL
jgi:hypothetical protein